ncbi:fibronectin type III domain-containing protein [Candidatus Peregrinibacteria bacterium]|jgi:hypothetical protein|nr:fibronectin type III domain-containing protein [Candidatus Peregrinibacteria bacterium]
MKKTLSKILSLVGIASLLALNSVTAFAADSEAPTAVPNFAGTALDSAVKLTWDASTDDTGVEGYQVHYGLTPVTKTGEVYDNVIDAGDVLEYTVGGLENGTTYYFSAIAYDAAANESAQWAEEFEMAPSADGGDLDDDEAPQVSEAEALNEEEVKIVFSEEVVIPEENAESAFDIESDETFEPLDVLGAEIDEDDETGKTVILTTAVQTEGEEYVLTAGIDVEDKAGNPIISGTSDTAAFTGSSDPKPAEDEVGPEVTKIDSVDNEHIIVHFDEVIVLNIDPAENFSIAEEADPTAFLQVLGVELTENSDGLADAAAIVKTSPQEVKNYVVTVIELEDESGNEVKSDMNSGIFAGVESEEDPGEDPGEDPDEETTVEDVANLVAEVVMEAEKYIVKLTWDVPTGNVGSVIEQILYLSEDEEEYDEKAKVSQDAAEYDVEGLESGDYWLKVTQMDTAGNETEGEIVKVTLSETGPGVAGLLLVSLGFGHIASRRKRK